MCRYFFLVTIIIVLIYDIGANSWWHFLTYICSAKVLQMNTLCLNAFHRQARQFEAHVYYKVWLTSRCLLQSSGISGHSRVKCWLLCLYMWRLHFPMYGDPVNSPFFLAQTVVLMHTVVKLQCILIMFWILNA